MIVLPVLAFIAAITLVGLPLAIGIGLAAAAARDASPTSISAYALGRRMVEAAAPPHALLPGRARRSSALAACVPVLGAIVGIAALVFGLGLIGAAIGAARGPDPGSGSNPGQLSTGIGG